MAAKKSNTRALDYNKVEKEPKVGTTICGFKLYQQYAHFNVWERNGPIGVRNYKTCFPRMTVPNERAVKTVIYSD